METITTEVDERDESFRGVEAKASMFKEADVVVHAFESTIADLPGDPGDRPIELLAHAKETCFFRCHPFAPE